MKIENIENYRRYSDAADKFEKEYIHYLSTKGKGGCDKYGMEFNRDIRFSSFSVNVSLDAWMGYYGSSSCYNAISCDKEIFANAFVEYCNQNKDHIIQGMIDIVRGRSEKYKEDAQKELSALQSELDKGVHGHKEEDNGKK